jgi:hypothetical protein
MCKEAITRLLPGTTTLRLLLVAAAIMFCSCKTTSVEQTWKSPEFSAGPVKKVAVIAIEDRGTVRQAFENRFNNQLKAGGEEALVTHDMFSLQEIKADKKAAAERLKQAGADTVLIVRLLDTQTYTREVRATHAPFVPVVTGIDSYYGWYDYFSVAYMDMGTVWGSLEQTIYIETSLFDLNTGKKVWRCMTETVLKENVDRLEVADALVGKVLAAARKDGMIR